MTSKKHSENYFVKILDVIGIRIKTAYYGIFK